MRFIDISLNNLVRRPVRSILTGLGTALAVASLIMLVGMAQGLEGAWSGSLLDRGVHLLASRKGAVEVLTGAIDSQVVSSLANEPGVAAAAGELVTLTGLADGKTVLAAGWRPESYLWRSLNLIQGQLPAVQGNDEVVVGETLAAALHLVPGDTMEVLGATFTVVGISRNQSALNQSGFIAPLASLQQLLGKKGKVTFVNLRFHDPGDEESMLKIQMALGNKYPELEFLQTNEVTRGNRILGIFRAMAWGTSLLALTISALFVLNTMAMSVTERTREIGILSALGWSRGLIMALIIQEGVVLSFAGGMMGLCCGTAGLKLLSGLEAIGAFIQPQVSLKFLFEIIAASVILGILGSLYPAWRAINLKTAQALKYE
jgi:putative ABC transport system permease protein